MMERGLVTAGLMNSCSASGGGGAPAGEPDGLSRAPSRSERCVSLSERCVSLSERCVSLSEHCVSRRPGGTQWRLNDPRTKTDEAWRYRNISPTVGHSYLLTGPTLSYLLPPHLLTGPTLSYPLPPTSSPGQHSPTSSPPHLLTSYLLTGPTLSYLLPPHLLPPHWANSLLPPHLLPPH